MGADDYQFEQGISYAWTVTAGTGDGGFTLFSNGGRSEARSFTYGCLCPVPYAPLPTSVRPSGATIGWEPDPLHMSFETGFRKAGDTEGTWHTVESYLGESSINNILEPLTSYEFRVRAFCFNGEWSDFSPLNRFTTAEMPKVDIECGAVDEKVVIANTVPKPMLYAGEVLAYGQWTLVVTEASGANGIFSGRCDMAVPLFNNAKVRMVFNGITVNELNQVTGGIVRSDSSDDSRMFAEDVTDYIYEGDQTGNIIDNAAVAGIELGFSGSGGLTASVSGDGSSATISSGSGSQTFSVDNLGDGTTVKDSDGNIYAVSADGEVTQIGASGGSSGTGSTGTAATGTSGTAGVNTTGATGAAASSNSTSSSNQAITDPGSLPLHPTASVTFSAAGKWALDERDSRYSGTPFDAEYSMLGDRYVPWKLVPAGKSDKIRATLSGSGIDPEKIRFIAADGTEFIAKVNGQGIDLEIIGAAAGDGYELFAVYWDPAASGGSDISSGTDISGRSDASGGTTSTQQASGSDTTNSSVSSSQSTINQDSQGSQYYLLGKLNVASYPLLKRSVMVVPMAGASVDAPSLEAAINAVYSGYGVTWDIGVDEAFDDMSWDTDGDGLDGGGSGPFSAYNAEMRVLNGSYSAARGVKENTVYLFWFGAPAGGNGALAGDMPLDGPFGYIFAPAAGPEIYSTVAHELGHGAFQLRHTFSDSYNVAQYTTDNLMDYPGGPVLKKYQWDLLHDPCAMVAKWAQNEEEGQIAILSSQDDCWEKGKENWDTNSPDKYLSIDKFEYDANCTFMYAPGLYRSYFNLTDGNILIVDEVSGSNSNSQETGEKLYQYHLYVASENEWYEIDIETFLEDCLVCKINDIATKSILLAGKTIGRYLLPIEDLYIMANEEDFDGEQASKSLATAFLLIEFIPGGQFLKPVTKGFNSAIKSSVRGARKVFKSINGTIMQIGEYVGEAFVPSKWIDGTEDEILETLSDITYVNKEGVQTKGTIQVVKKDTEVGFKTIIEKTLTNLSLNKLTGKASIDIPWKNLDDKNIIWASPNTNALHTAKSFANETGSSLYDIVLKGGDYVKFDLSDGRILLGNTDGTYRAFAVLEDVALTDFKITVLSASDEVFNTKLAELLSESANKLKVLSGAISKQITIADKSVTLSSSKVNTFIGRFRPDIRNIFNECGSFKNVGLGETPGGINLLNKPDHYFDASSWWTAYNKPWLNNAIERGDDIYLATIPQKADEIFNSTGKLDGAFAEELNLLVSKNYKPKNLTDIEWSNIKSWF